MTIQSTIESLSAEFASKLVAAMRGMSIEELVSVTANNGAPLADRPRRAVGEPRGKRTQEDIEKQAQSIAAAVKKNPNGIRSEEIRKLVGLSALEIMLPLKAALKAKLITKKGQRRSTTYFAK